MARPDLEPILAELDDAKADLADLKERLAAAEARQDATDAELADTKAELADTRRAVADLTRAAIGAQLDPFAADHERKLPYASRALAQQAAADAEGSETVVWDGLNIVAIRRLCGTAATANPDLDSGSPAVLYVNTPGRTLTIRAGEPVIRTAQGRITDRNGLSPEGLAASVRQANQAGDKTTGPPRDARSREAVAYTEATYQAVKEAQR